MLVLGAEKESCLCKMHGVGEAGTAASNKPQQYQPLSFVCHLSFISQPIHLWLLWDKHWYWFFFLFSPCLRLLSCTIAKLWRNPHLRAGWVAENTPPRKHLRGAEFANNINPTTMYPLLIRDFNLVVVDKKNQRMPDRTKLQSSVACTLTHSYPSPSLKIRTSFVSSDRLSCSDVPALSADMQPNSSCSSVQWWSMKRAAEAVTPGGPVDGEHCQLLLLSDFAPHNVHKIKYWPTGSL